MTNASSPLIDADHASFIQGGVGISVAACDRHNIPTLVRGSGSRVSDDRRRLTVFVSAIQAAPVIRCIRDNAAIAVVFSKPSTHRTVQLKGTDAAVGGLREGDLQLVCAYRDAFTHELMSLGHDETLIRTLLSYPSADLVALSFTPSEAFSQTPGPKAGEPLRVGT